MDRKIKAIAIPMDVESRDEILQKASVVALELDSNPSSVIRAALFDAFGIEPKAKPRKYISRKVKLTEN